MFHLDKIEIQNFGLHKQFSHTFNGSLTGIIGLNGSGKSTLRQAIEWGMRGSITHKDPIAEFVHAADGIPHYPMQVTLEFTADGRQPPFPRLRSGHRLFQRPSHKKQIPSSKSAASSPSVPRSWWKRMAARKSSVRAAV